MRLFASILLTLTLFGCSKLNLERPNDPFGNFRLGHIAVYGENITKGPFSRDATDDEIKGALYAALQQQLGQYTGNGEYHIVVIVDAYTLGKPGIPLIFSPQTALGFRLSVWEAQTMTRFDLTPEKLLFLENANSRTLFGSGLRQTREEQIVSLTQSVAQQIDTWLREKHVNDDWFDPKSDVKKYTLQEIEANIAE